MAKFRVKTENLGTGKIDSWIFDTVECTMKNEDKDACITGYANKDIEPNFDQPFVLRSITILVGLNCNLECNYCIQRTENISLGNINLTPSRVDSLIENLSKLDTSQVNRLCFWGGETMLYYKAIKLALPRIKEMMPNLERIIIATNGTLLTKEVLEWALENGVSFQISDDGDNTERFDGSKYSMTPIRKVIDDFAKTHRSMRISNHAVLSRNNPDAVAMCYELDKSYPHTKMTVALQSVFVPRDRSNIDLSYFVDYTPEELLLVYDSVFTANFDDVCQRFIVKTKNEVSRIKTLFTRNVSREFVCHIPKGEITVDWMGRVYFCRETANTDSIICTVDDFGPDYTEKVRQKATFYPIAKKTGCRGCFLFNTCHGGCSAYDSETMRLNCVSKFAMHLGFMNAAFVKKLGLLIVGLEPASEDAVFTDWMKLVANHRPDYEESLAKWKESKKRVISISVS